MRATALHRPDGHAVLREVRLHLGDGVGAVVEDARRQPRVGPALLQRVQHVLRAPRAAARDNGHRHHLALRSPLKVCMRVAGKGLWFPSTCRRVQALICTPTP